MEHVWMELKLHGPEVAAVLLFLISETLGLSKNTAIKSVLQLLVPKLRVIAQPELDKLAGK